MNNVLKDNSLSQNLGENKPDSPPPKKFFNTKIIILIVILVIFPLGITGCYFFGQKKSERRYEINNTIDQQNDDQPKVRDRQSTNNLNSGFRNAIGKRLIFEVLSHNQDAAVRTTTVYGVLLDKNMDPIKISEWDRYYAHNDDLKKYSKNEIAFFNNSYDSNLNIIEHDKNYDRDQIAKKYNIENLLYNFFHSKEQISHDGKKVAFMSHTVDIEEDAITKLNLISNKLYVQDIITGKRSFYDLPGGGENWTVLNWSSDNKRIYLRRYYYEVHTYSPDGILIFNTERKNIDRILLADKLLFPIEYDNSHELFYGIEYNTDPLGNKLTGPSKLWQIDGRTRKEKLLFSSDSDIIQISYINGNGSFIFNTSSYDDDMGLILKNLYIYVRESSAPKILNLRQSHNDTVHNWLLSEDDKYILWMEGKSIWKYDLANREEAEVINLYTFQNGFSEKQFNGMVIF